MGIGFPKPQRKVNEDLLERVRQMPCSVCGAEGPSDPSHIRSRGSGGGDQHWNVFPKCRPHHTEWGTIGWMRFLGKYPLFADLLLENGWDIQFVPPSLWHRSLA